MGRGVSKAGKARGRASSITSAESSKGASFDFSGDYYSFSDKSIKSGSRHRGGDTWDYAGDGEAQRTYFQTKSNYDELIRVMERNEREAFESWSRGEFMLGQMYRNPSTWSNAIKKEIATYDKYLDRSEVKTATQVVRLSDAQLLLGKGNKYPTSIGQLQALKGTVVNSKSCLSFAAASEGLTIGQASSKKVEYVLKIPAGAKGVGMYIGDPKINVWGRRQREFMTNRDANYVVGDTKYDSKRGVYVVELGYLDHDAHRY